LDEEESNACLGKQNGFGPTFLHTLLRLLKGVDDSRSLTPGIKESNK
jgi:hypothetical protein